MTLVIDMAFVRTKYIKGNPYLYLQESERDGDQVISKHIRYIGKGELGTTTVEERNIIYGSLHDERSNKSIAQDMQQNAKKVYDDPKDWDKTGKNISDLRGWDTTDIKEYREDYARIYYTTEFKLRKTFPKESHSGRIKTLPSMVKKLKKKNVKEPFTHKDFGDIVGTRITFKNTSELKKGVIKVKKNYKVLDTENYVDNPKEGYRSYHFTLEEEGKPIELQLRTENQTRWADWTHDRLYDNISKTKERVGEKGYREAREYSINMSNYYDKLDRGEKAVKPETPDVVKNKMGGGIE